MLNGVGGLEGLSRNLPDVTKQWNGGLSNLQLLGYFLPLFLSILGDQNMYQRFAEAKDEKTARKSTIEFFVGSVLVNWINDNFYNCGKCDVP